MVGWFADQKDFGYKHNFFATKNSPINFIENIDEIGLHQIHYSKLLIKTKIYAYVNPAISHVPSSYNLLQAFSHSFIVTFTNHTYIGLS